VLEDPAGDHRVLVLVQHRKVAVFRRLHRVGQLQLGEQVLQLVPQDLGHLLARLLVGGLVLVEREVEQYSLGRHGVEFALIRRAVEPRTRNEILVMGIPSTDTNSISIGH